MSEQPPRPVMKVGVDMRLTADDIARLTPEQARAVFEGVGRIAALLTADPHARRP